jgi:hypothetical protein
MLRPDGPILTNKEVEFHPFGLIFLLFTSLFFPPSSLSANYNFSIFEPLAADSFGLYHYMSVSYFINL